MHKEAALATPRSCSLMSSRPRAADVFLQASDFPRRLPFAGLPHDAAGDTTHQCRVTPATITGTEDAADQAKLDRQAASQHRGQEEKAQPNAADGVWVAVEACSLLSPIQVAHLGDHGENFS